jgi:hypothetical protein
MFQAKVVEKIKTLFVFSNFLFPKFVPFMRQVKDENKYTPCALDDKASDMQNM